MVKNFRFEEEGAIALSGYPENAAAVDWLYEQGIRAVVSLHPVPEEAQGRMVERGIRWHPFVLSDFAAGLPGSLEEAVGFIREQAETEPAVLIHCQGGGGRSGTLFAAYLVRQGVPVENVLVRVPGVDKEVNRAFLHGYAAGLKAHESGVIAQ